MRTLALLMAAGSGTRLGGEPKQLRLLAGKPLYAWSLDALRAHPAIDDVIVVTAQPERFPDGLTLIAGGQTRQQSVRNGLEAIAATGGAERVLIHDAARPLLPPDVIDRLLDALNGHEGAVPALPVADSLRRGTGLMGADVAREGLNRIQTPQAFRFAAILAAHRAAAPGASDDAMLLPSPVALVQGDERLAKVTSLHDWERLQMTMLADVRTGSGFDVHRFGPGDHVWLGGVRVPHDAGVVAHSDGDVALHALTDALLGAIGAGDIGVHFPPSDPRWRSAQSSRFVIAARDMVQARGGMIAHVDVTLIAERPRLTPHREAMRQRIAELLEIAPDRVSLKATTTEQLGFTGRREGIAAQATATVRLP